MKTGEKPWEKYRVCGDVLVSYQWLSGGWIGSQETHLALGDLGLDGGPRLALGGIGEQVHDDGTARDGLVDLEEVLAGNPAILLGILPRLAVLPDADDDVEAVVTEVEALAVALRAVADQRERVVLEVVEDLVAWPVVAF